MNTHSILVPFVGMMTLTMAVFLYMFFHRIREIRRSQRMPKTRADLDKYPPIAVNSSNNFQNLFELPVLFYGLVLAIELTQTADAIHVSCAYGFLGFRTLHSIIHCTYNNISHRFSAYALAAACLWVMVIRFGLGLL